MDWAKWGQVAIMPPREEEYQVKLLRSLPWNLSNRTLIVASWLSH